MEVLLSVNFNTIIQGFTLDPQALFILELKVCARLLTAPYFPRPSRSFESMSGIRC